LRFNEMNDTEKRALSPDELESCLANEFQWFSVPIAAQRLRVTLGSAVLPPSEPLLPTPTMFE